MPIASASNQVGPYRLLKRLGLGGMAEVYLASHEPMPGSSRLVAIKRILANLVDQPSFLQMFLDEARVLSRLYHPNLDRVLGAGEHDGVPYIVLDYVPGRDLSIILRAHEKRSLLPIEVSVHIATRIAAGLCHAHGLRNESGESLEIVHRDLSPENIILTFEGTVKVVDFGVARGTIRDQVTEPGLIKGKPSFMAPEQILAKPIDHRADIFAMGLLLYRLTVGRHPFGIKGDDPRTFMRLIDTIPTPPHLIVPDYPHSLSAVVMKALEKEPHARHASADDLLTDLEGVMKERGWFPSDSRLAKLMNELFPSAAEAARRLTVSPGDAEAATQASYMTRGDLRFEIVETETEPASESEGTLTATHTEGPDDRDGDLTRTETGAESRFASFIGTQAPKLSDEVTAADMDTIPTGPGGPAPRAAPKPSPRPGFTGDPKDSRLDSHAVVPPPPPRDARLDPPESGPPPPRAPLPKRPAPPPPHKGAGLEAPTAPDRPRFSEPPPPTPPDSTNAETRLDIPRSMKRAPTPASPQGSVGADRRLADDDPFDMSTTVEAPIRRLGDTPGVEEDTLMEAPVRASGEPKQTVEQGFARHVGSSDRPRPKPPVDLPPPPKDSRLLCEPDEGMDSSVSAYPTHSSLDPPKLSGKSEDFESATSIESMRTSPRWKSSGPKGEVEQRAAPVNARSARREIPAWRTPFGLIFTLVVGVTVTSAILFSVCGQ